MIISCAKFVIRTHVEFAIKIKTILLIKSCGQFQNQTNIFVKNMKKHFVLMVKSVKLLEVINVSILENFCFFAAYFFFRLQLHYFFFWLKLFNCFFTNFYLRKCLIKMIYFLQSICLFIYRNIVSKNGSLETKMGWASDLKKHTKEIYLLCFISLCFYQLF